MIIPFRLAAFRNIPRGIVLCSCGLFFSQFLMNEAETQASRPDMRPKPGFILGLSGRIIIQDSWNGLAIYTIKDGKKLHTIRTEGSVNQAILSPDEKKIAFI